MTRTFKFITIFGHDMLRFMQTFVICEAGYIVDFFRSLRLFRELNGRRCVIFYQRSCEGFIYNLSDSKQKAQVEFSDRPLLSVLEFTFSLSVKITFSSSSEPIRNF